MRGTTSEAGEPAEEGPYALEVRDLKASYGQAKALFGVSLVVRPGEVVGVLGRNGAGKSTLLRTIARLHEQDSGTVCMHGRDLSALRPDEVSTAGLGIVREGAQVFASLSATELLILAGRLARRRGLEPLDVEKAWEWFPFLKPRKDVRADLLSGGQRQALLLASALVSRPRVLLLDEPSAGLAPVVAEELFSVLRSLIADQDELTLLVAEQNPQWLEGLADRAVLLETGEVVGDGATATVTAIASEHIPSA